MHTSFITRRYTSVFLVLFIFILSGCTKNPTGEKELTCTELPIAYSAVTHMAYDKGFISEEGLDYKLISVPAGPDVVTALRSGGDKAADCGTIAITPVITMIGGGGHPVVLATIMKSNQRVQLIAHLTSGITEDPTTLKGKKLGYVARTVGEVYLSKLLEKGGLSEKDVTLINGKPADLKALFLRGDIDAAILWEPFVAQAVRESKNQEGEKGDMLGDPVVYVDPTLYTLRFNIVTTEEKLHEKREQILKFLRASIKAGYFIEENPKEARKLTEDWLKLGGSDLDGFFETTSFRVYLNVPEIKTAMNDELEWLRNRQPDTTVPKDLSPYVDASLLKSIAPDRVKE